MSSLGGGALADAVDSQTLGIATMATSAVVLAETALMPPVALAFVAWFFLLGVVMWAASR